MRGAHNVVGASGSFTFRERPTLVYVPLEKLDQNVTVQFGEEVMFGYANLAVKVQPSYVVQELSMASAAHSKHNSVLTDLSNAGGSYATLVSGESIELHFAAPPLAPDMKRDFILFSQGRYEHLQGSVVEKPKEFQLEQNYPNPFNPSTEIRYSIPEDVYVTLKVYDMLGREVATLVNGMQDAGFKSVQFDAGRLSSGVYFYRLQTESFASHRTMLLLK